MKANFDYCYEGLAPPGKDDVPAVLKAAGQIRLGYISGEQSCES